MQNQKGFVKMLVVIIIFIIIVAIVYVKMNSLTITDNAENIADDFPISESSSSSSVATVDNVAKNEKVAWKTYGNDKNGFEIKYPGNWKMKEYKDNNGKIISVAFDPADVASQSSFETLDTPAGLVGIKLAENNSHVIGYEDFEPVEIGQGIVAKKFEEKTDDNGPSPAWYNKHAITYYIGDKIKIEYVSDLDDKHLKTFNQIISSLKFIK